ncbi:hypothetical protein [Pseudofrankia sp. BMG5.36]|uniref:hypothetical protein n=1 Tax=Pseudofrankia sp. BMG5.36 TaxID=1834512 RepID=UPI0008DADCCA|nr:hypothetical protein [Pseudofrankia sp. BMG5.36]OHV58932.1 hypothetical protein BCD48_05865 [Pseudofrankia sp. BMG5.36]
MGQAAIVLGLLGAAQAVATVAWPAQVSDGQYSYPFTPHWYTAAMIFFAVQQLGVLAGIGGIALLARARASQATRAGLLIGTIATILLMAIAAIAAITTAHDAAGLGPGRGIRQRLRRADDRDRDRPGHRRHRSGPTAGPARAGPGRAGPGRWIVLALGIYVFVPMLPALFEPVVLGRLAFGLWMLLVAALGLILVRAGRSPVDPAALRHRIAECDRKLARHRAAIETGVDPTSDSGCPSASASSGHRRWSRSLRHSCGWRSCRTRARLATGTPGTATSSRFCKPSSPCPRCSTVPVRPSVL